MKAEVVLMVAEGKRLIAKGVARLDVVRERLRKGMIVLVHWGSDRLRDVIG
jgi:hypothetical protein